MEKVEVYTTSREIVHENSGCYHHINGQERLVFALDSINIYYTVLANYYTAILS